MDPVVKVVVEVAGILLLGSLGEFIFARTRVPDVVWRAGRWHPRRPRIRSYPGRSTEARHPVLRGHRPDSHTVKRSVSSPTERGGRGRSARYFSRFVGYSFFLGSRSAGSFGCQQNWNALCAHRAAAGMADGGRDSRRHQFGYHHANDGHGSSAFQSSAHAGGRVLRN